MNFCLDARTITPHFPGIGRYVSNLANALPPVLKEDETLLLLQNPGGSSVLWSEEIVQKGKIRFLSTPSSPFSLSQHWQLPGRLQQAGAGLYHSPYYLMPYKLQFPVALTVYDLIPLHFPQYVSARARLLFRITTRLALGAATRIIAISNTSRDDFLRAFKLPPEKITCIPLAAGPRFHPQPNVELTRTRQKYSLPENYGLYVGSNKPHKNLTGLLAAWAQFTAQASKKPLLVLAGAWDQRYPQAKQWVLNQDMQDAVRFVGPVDDGDLPALLSGARLFILPSLYEGFGLPALEALACGAPVACARTSSLQEVAGEAALYFDPQNAAEMASVISRIWADETLSQELRARGPVQAANFSWQRTAQETINVYRQAVSATR